ncbi:hypothetical protein BPUN_1144 [Candidatus Paraburkholderia kirkii]|nr:hypothetical protein BPUN_1144 [Candidatus Paraburkholderia kirkii]
MRRVNRVRSSAFKARGDDSRPPRPARAKARRAVRQQRGERASGGDERRPFKPRGDDSRPAFGERGPRKSAGGRPVKSREDREGRDDRASGPRTARRDENERPFAKREERSEARKPAPKSVAKSAAPVAESAPMTTVSCACRKSCPNSAFARAAKPMNGIEKG